MNPQLTTVGMKVKPTANTFPAVLVLFSNTATQENLQLKGRERIINAAVRTTLA